VAITNDQIEFYAGDRRVLGWTLTLAAGGALNLTGKTVRWALVKGTAENYKTLTTQILIGRNATVTVPATGGLCTITLASADTASLAAGSYYWELELVDGPETEVLAVGTISLLRNVEN